MSLAQARQHFLTGRFRLAQEACETTLAGEGPSEALLEWLDLAASTAYRIGRYQEADRWLSLAMAQRLRDQQRFDRGLERTAFTWLALGQTERAEHHLTQSERLTRRYYDPHQREMLVPSLEAQSALALVAGRYPVAERAAKRAVARAKPGPLWIRALTGLARTMWYQGRAHEALAICQELSGQEAPTRACERWLWSHLAVAYALAGDLEGARRAARTVGALADKDASLLLGWSWLNGQLAALGGDLAGASTSWNRCRELAAELYPDSHLQRALVAFSLAQSAWREKRVDRALLMAEEALTMSPDHWFGGRALRALTLELSAQCHLELRSTSRALELTAEALDTLRGDDEAWLAVGAGGVVHWHDLLDDDEPGSWLPLCWPLGNLEGETELQASMLSTRARALRQAGRDEEASASARQARSARQTSGRGALSERSSHLMGGIKLTCLELRLQAPGRLPRWVRVLDDLGKTQSVGVDEDEKGLLVGSGVNHRMMFPDDELFHTELGAEPLSLELLVNEKPARRVAMMPYLVTIGFETGPPLRIPVRSP